MFFISPGYEKKIANDVLENILGQEFEGKGLLCM